MREPPEPPITKESLPSLETIVGVMDDSGRLPGAKQTNGINNQQITEVPIKFAFDGSKLNAFGALGMEKSSI